MITIGNSTKLQLVQIIPGVAVALEGESDPVWYHDVALWYNPGQHYCECEDLGGCDTNGLLWGTSDPYEPGFCTKHYFGAAIAGYEFVGLA